MGRQIATLTPTQHNVQQCTKPRRCLQSTTERDGQTMLIKTKEEYLGRSLKIGFGTFTQGIVKC